MFAFRRVVKLRLRYLERPELGTPYPEIVERVAEVTRSPELAGRCKLIADATGWARGGGHATEVENRMHADASAYHGRKHGEPGRMGIITFLSGT